MIIAFSRVNHFMLLLERMAEQACATGDPPGLQDHNSRLPCPTPFTALHGRHTPAGACPRAARHTTLAGLAQVGPLVALIVIYRPLCATKCLCSWTKSITSQEASQYPMSQNPDSSSSSSVCDMPCFLITAVRNMSGTV